MVVEKQSKGVPCTHHIHAYIQYAQPIQLATLKKNIKSVVAKHHGPELDSSIMAVMLKTNCCYTYKDYLGKYEDSINVHGDDFDADLFKKHMPDEEMQALLQAAVPNRPITTLWANHEEKWREFSPDNLSSSAQNTCFYQSLLFRSSGALLSLTCLRRPAAWGLARTFGGRVKPLLVLSIGLRIFVVHLCKCVVDSGNVKSKCICSAVVAVCKEK